MSFVVQKYKPLIPYSVLAANKVTITGSVLFTLLILGVTLSLVLGPVSFSAIDGILSIVDKLFSSQLSELVGYQSLIVWELRFPRLMLAILVGAILAQCGAVMQGLFRNPLADPGIIGVSSGAAIGAIVSIGLMPDALQGLTTPAFAFLGGLLTTLLVYGLARSKQGTSILMLLLAGVAISAFAGALIGFISYFADDQKLRALSLWQMGSLSGANTLSLWTCAGTLLFLSVMFQLRANDLNALLLGEAEARHLGVGVERLKRQLIIVTAIGVGVAVASSGVIGFVGLVVPHIIRLLTGPNHRTLLPLSALCGALLLTISDLIGRQLVQPAELPVGLITALFGAPFFLALLVLRRDQWA